MIFLDSCAYFAHFLRVLGRNLYDFAFSIFDWVKPWIGVKNQLSNFAISFIYIMIYIEKQFFFFIFYDYFNIIAEKNTQKQKYFK